MHAARAFETPGLKYILLDWRFLRDSIVLLLLKLRLLAEVIALTTTAMRTRKGEPRPKKRNLYEIFQKNMESY